MKSPSLPALAAALALFAPLAVACTNGPSRDASIAGDSLHGAAPAGAAPLDAAQGRDVAAADRLIGRLLHEVVPDSALWGSWTVYPIERRIGLRVAQLADGWWLLGDTLAGYDGPTAHWRVRAARQVPAPRQGEQYVGSCLLTGATENDGTIAARMTRSAGEALTPIHGAWRLDPGRWRFTPVPVDSLACYNEGGG